MFFFLNLFSFCFYKRHLERARIALDIEHSLSKAKRQLQRNKYWVNVQGERYLQVEEVSNDISALKDEEINEDED